MLLLFFRHLSSPYAGTCRMPRIPGVFSVMLRIESFTDRFLADRFISALEMQTARDLI
jgi:hypothetical protein